MSTEKRESGLPTVTVEVGPDQLKRLQQYHKEADKLSKVLDKMQSKAKNPNILFEEAFQLRRKRYVASGLIKDLTLGLEVVISGKGNCSRAVLSLSDADDSPEAIIKGNSIDLLLSSLWPDNEKGSKDEVLKWDILTSLTHNGQVVLKPAPEIVKAKPSA